MDRGAPCLPPHRPAPRHQLMSLANLHPKKACQVLGVGGSSDTLGCFFFKATSRRGYY